MVNAARVFAFKSRALSLFDAGCELIVSFVKRVPQSAVALESAPISISEFDIRFANPGVVPERNGIDVLEMTLPFEPEIPIETEAGRSLAKIVSCCGLVLHAVLFFEFPSGNAVDSFVALEMGCIGCDNGTQWSFWRGQGSCVGWNRNCLHRPSSFRQKKGRMVIDRWC